MLKIVKVNEDGHTGHVSIDAQVVEQISENETRTGAVETFGIHPGALQDGFAGDHMQWLDSIHREMLTRHEDRKTSAKALKNLQGTTIMLDEEKHGNQS